MITELETKLYELSYLLNGDLGDEKAIESGSQLRELIAGKDGIIIYEKQPQKQKLPYPIKNCETAHMGFLRFLFPLSEIDELKKSINMIPAMLRFLINRAKKEKESIKKDFRKQTPISQPSKESVTAETPEKAPLQVEEIDKKLEEILGK